MLLGTANRGFPKPETGGRVVMQLNSNRAMNQKFITDLRPALRALYASQLHRSATWNDESDHAFINNHLIERSFAGLALRLSGELIDVGCGRQPYRAYFRYAPRKSLAQF